MSSQVGAGLRWCPKLLWPPFSLSPHFLRAVIYLNIQVVKGQRKVICLLKEQIRNVSPACVVSGSGHLSTELLGFPLAHLCLFYF